MHLLDLTLATWPWAAFPLVGFWRARGSRSLDEEPAEAQADAPLVSVVVPARDERRNIVACLRSILSSTYPRLEVVVVDDHSTDATGDLARDVASDDPRCRIVQPPPLPRGWFGKQWACAAGADAAHGTILCFADADTRHAPDLISRAVHALDDRRADLLSVVGSQELGTFWERVVQPQIFAVMASRYGSTERIARSRHPYDKIANGQCLFVRRDAYEVVGGHGSVRGSVSEDLVLAKRVFAAGRHVAIVLGTRQLSTRMYTSLGELTRGWRKNMFAGGREGMPDGAVRALFPILIVIPPLFSLLPLLLLAAYALGWAHPITGASAAIATCLTVVTWTAVYRRLGVPARYALAYPLGALVLLGIVLQAISRGRRVEWKGRDYVSA